MFLEGNKKARITVLTTRMLIWKSTHLILSKPAGECSRPYSSQPWTVRVMEEMSWELQQRKWSTNRSYPSTPEKETLKCQEFLMWRQLKVATGEISSSKVCEEPIFPCGKGSTAKTKLESLTHSGTPLIPPWICGSECQKKTILLLYVKQHA